MGNRKYKRGFQYFSVIVPTHYDDSLTSNGQQPEPRVEKPSDDPCEPPTELEPSNNSYLRFGDTPTTQDMKGKEEPGFELRSLLEGTPAWSSRLYQGFAPNENALRVGAGEAIEFNGGLESNFYKNVGWVDHSNGHRVTTTHGDKVEVITGNYKLVVLGREGNPEGSTGFDMSGGHTVNWAKTPGCVRTITAEGNSFKVTHVTDKGHEYTVFDGYDTDHIVGGSTSISVMGGKSELTAYASEAEKESAPILPMALVVDQAWSNTIVDGDYGTTIVDIDAGEPKEKESWAFSETNDLKTNAGDLSQYPDKFSEVDAFPAASRVIEARRAKQYDEWVSVDGTFTEEVHAGQFDFTLDCVAKGGTGAFSEHISAITMDNKVNVSGTVTEHWVANQYNEYFFGNRKNFTHGVLEQEYHHAINKFDFVNAVVSWTEMSLVGGARTAVDYSGVRTEIDLGVLKIDVACPFRVEKTGTDVKNATVELYNAAVELRKTTAARIASGGLEIKNRIAAIFT